MSRKDLLHLLQERCRSLGVDRALLHAGAGARRAAGHARPRGRRRRRQLADPGRVRRRVPARPGPARATSTCGSAPTGSSRRSSSSSSRRRGAPCRSTATRTRTQGSTFIVEMHEDVWRAAGFDATEHDRAARPARRDEQRVARLRELFADELDGHELHANNSKWLNFTTVRNERWHDGNLVLLGDAAHTAHFSIGSGTKLAMEDALALAACLHEHPDVETALARVRGRAAAGRRVHPARGAGVAGVVREHRHVRAPGADAVLLQPADPLAADHLRRTCAPATRSSPTAWTPRSPRRRARTTRGPGDVPAVPARRARAEEPGHRLADGHVLRGRRHAGRLPPRAPRLEGAWAAPAW